MPKKVTFPEFLNRSVLAHGPRFLYNEESYKSMTKNMVIFCREHGSFFQIPKVHLRASNSCPGCSPNAKLLNVKEPVEKRLASFDKIHEGKYDYSLLPKSGGLYGQNIITVICPKHGEFQLSVESHMSGAGCTECEKDNPVDKLEIRKTAFLIQFQEKFGDRFKYDMSNYKTSTSKIKITCPIHGEFEMTSSSHVRSLEGCPTCSRTAGANNHHNNSLNAIKKNFISESTKVHKGKYDYSKVDYKNSTTKVVIICPEHGEFKQRPAQHIQGCGCIECAKLVIGKKNSKGFKHFLSKFKAVHGDRYSYDESSYITGEKKMRIICPEHGEFMQAPATHSAGHGCPHCANALIGAKSRTPTSVLLERFKATHGERYDYSRVNFVNTKTNIEIICRKHGVFEQKPEAHLNGHGCRKCWYEEMGQLLRITQEDFLTRASNRHGDQYDYSQVVYVTSKDPVIITCKKHGVFSQTPEMHMSGKGCPKCGIEKASKAKTNDTAYFLKRAIKAHGDKYDYSKAEYTSATDKITIICPKHGEFKQTAAGHMYGQGCPKCSHPVSKEESRLGDYLESLGETVVRSSRDVIAPKELDIYLPEHKLAVEYNGAYWHSEASKSKTDARTHLREKTAICAKHGIRLIHVCSSEDHVIVEKTLAHILGKTKKVYARKCKLVKPSELTSAQIRSFYNENHLQGSPGVFRDTYALSYEDKIVAMMTITNSTSRRTCSDETYFELKRFSASRSVVGGASRLLKAFIRDNPVAKKIVSFSYNNWFTGAMYSALGFTLDKELAPDYKYTKGHSVYPKNKFTKTRMAEMPDFDFNPDETEQVNCWNNGYYRVWDSGKKRWMLEL